MVKRRVPMTAIVTRVIILVFAVSLFFGQLGARALLHLSGPGSGVMETSTYWFSLLAPAFFLMALWAASDAFVQMDRGEAFGPTMIRGLCNIGWNLMLGAFAAIVVQPSLVALAANGFTEMRAMRIDLDVENLTLLLIGLLLVLLAKHGSRMKSKLDSFV